MSDDHGTETPWDKSGQTMAQECSAIEADLERLKALVNDAAGRLLGSFNEFMDLEAHANRSGEERARINAALAAAVTALQFQDMASQLTGHAQRRLLALESCLRDTYGDTVKLDLMGTQPVRQAEMSAGSVDLF
jgi:hypothetical protein